MEDPTCGFNHTFYNTTTTWNETETDPDTGDELLDPVSGEPVR